MTYADATAAVNSALARAASYASAQNDVPPRWVLDHMDILIVAADLPVGHAASDQVQRFRALVQSRHQF